MHPTRSLLALAALTLASTPTIDAQTITLDGILSDWPEGVHTLADASHVYVRVDLEDTTSLQSSQRAIHLRFDLDGDDTTGTSFPQPPDEGVDLEIVISPSFGNSRQDDFVTARIIPHSSDVSGEVSIPIVDLLWAPTHASDSFEIRFDRAGELGPLIQSSSNATLQISAFESDSSLAWQREPVPFTLPPYESRAPSSAAIPERPESTIRVVSWNVRWGNPYMHPERFDRVFQALDPDVLLLQEWDMRDSPPDTRAQIVEWFTQSLPDVTTWGAERGNAAGVVIVSRFPIERFSPYDVQPITEGLELARDDRTVRFIGARIRTPQGDLLTGSFHLKCCGSHNGYEDHQRRAEARGINAIVEQAINQETPTGVFLAGDMNLVGGAEPLLDLIDSLDLDGSHLSDTHTPILGDNVLSTWAGFDTRFPRGRLDYALYSDATIDVVNSFILDVSVLSPQVLDAHGLEPDDRDASDHLPLVFDLLMRGESTE
ncbi:MAG: endonuclease/exonuclease/phosphatase family protein [Phycisphaerales bacterium JB043]